MTENGELATRLASVHPIRQDPEHVRDAFAKNAFTLLPSFDATTLEGPFGTIWLGGQPAQTSAHTDLLGIQRRPKIWGRGGKLDSDRAARQAASMIPAGIPAFSERHCSRSESLLSSHAKIDYVCPVVKFGRNFLFPPYETVVGNGTIRIRRGGCWTATTAKCFCR